MVKKELNFILFIKLMPNLEVLTAVDDSGDGTIYPSIDLNSSFCDSIIACIDYLSLSISSFSFSKFEIVEAETSINQLITIHQWTQLQRRDQI